jgi:hypothetical protein
MSSFGASQIYQRRVLSARTPIFAALSVVRSDLDGHGNPETPCSCHINGPEVQMPKHNKEVKTEKKALKKAAKKAEKKAAKNAKVDRSDIKGTTFTT